MTTVRELGDAEFREQVKRLTQIRHDCFIKINRAIFLECPPEDLAPYVYTYYDGNGQRIYHGYTTDACRRAKEHFKHAPWASWIEDVRYRKCSTAKAARRLESRLMRKVPAMCRWAYHDDSRPLWADIDRKLRINHVTGSCKLPGGSCDVDWWVHDLKQAVPFNKVP